MMPPVSGNTALLLDIDGTLLDLARTPERVRVPGELLRALVRLTHQLHGALAFVSGRSFFFLLQWRNSDKRRILKIEMFQK